MQTNTATKEKKVLIVEDDGEMCLLLNILLDDNQLDLNHVKNIASAKSFLENEQPAVVILDNKLPDGFGVDFINIIKKEYPAIKIIMISGLGAAKDLALENGADIFLEKPFSKEQLFKSVNSLLN
ncbi:hypothetical protein BH09BAC2_BH09BAC2_12120 [soil metagenome]